MAHFAELDENNIVTQVIVVNNETLNFLEFPFSEDIGIEFCKSIFPESNNWKQTSYNHSFRKNFAANGYFYDVKRDAFIPPKDFDSWVLNENTCLWESPIPYPRDDKMYIWDETIKSWTEY